MQNRIGLENVFIGKPFGDAQDIRLIMRSHAELNGSDGWTRTSNQVINSHLLYH